MKANPRSRAPIFRTTVSRVPFSAASSPSRPAGARACGLAIVLAAVLSGCVPPPATPTSTPSAAPAPRPGPALPPVADWRDAPITPGDWTYAANAGGSLASFGGGLLALRCDPQGRTVTLVRAAAYRAGPVSLTVTTSNTSRTLAGRATAAGIEVTLPARDPVLDSMAFSRGRFAITTSGEPTLYVPSWTEVTRVIEDCR